MFIADTGLTTYEEINGPLDLTAGVTNFGFPCYEGNFNHSEYAALNTGICDGLYAAPATVAAPLYTYSAANNDSRVSISALAFHNGRIFYGDYSQSLIASLYPNGTGWRVEATGAIWPADLLSVPNVGLVYVDVVTGSVKLAPLASPSPAPHNSAPGVSIALSVAVGALLAVVSLLS